MNPGTSIKISPPHTDSDFRLSTKPETETANWRGRAVIRILISPFVTIYIIFKKAITFLCQNIAAGAKWIQLVLNEYTVSHPNLPGGFKNAGNTCYLAALIQSLNAIEGFTKEINDLNENTIKKYSDEEVYQFEIRKSIIDKWKTLTLLSNARQTVPTHEIHGLRKLLHDYAPDKISMHNQEDAHDICELLFEIFQHYPIMYQKTFLHEPLQNPDDSDSEILKCPTEEWIQEKASILQASIPEYLIESSSTTPTLQLQDLWLQEVDRRETAAKSYTDGKLQPLPKGTLSLTTIQILMEDSDSNSNNDRPHSHLNGKYGPPSFIAVRLKRFFIQDQDVKKVFTPVLPPDFFDIYVANTNKKIRYCLKACTVHEGGDNEGHYQSYVKKNIDNGNETRTHWALFNDNKVRALC